MLKHFEEVKQNLDFHNSADKSVSDSKVFVVIRIERRKCQGQSSVEFYLPFPFHGEAWGSTTLDNTVQHP
jgi:hypothetical protein